MREIVILGAGGGARETALLIEDINRAQTEPRWDIRGHVDAGDGKRGRLDGRYPLLGDDSWLVAQGRDVDVAIGIGTPAIRCRVHRELRGHGHIHFPNLIHPSVIMDPGHVAIGEGNVICAGCILTTDVTIGNCNLLNRASTYGHDFVVSDYCVFNPGVVISGGVCVESGCLIGAGATILQYLTIGPDATVGAGALVNRDVETGRTVAGVPARPMQHARSSAAACGRSGGVHSEECRAGYGSA